MCWVLSQACFVRLWRARLVSVRAAAIAAVATTVGVIGIFGAIGYFGDTKTGASGFGQYSADLLTLVNPDQFSRLLTRFRIANEQWEGLGFLGLGGLVAVAIAIGVIVRRRPCCRAGTWVVIAACVRWRRSRCRPTSQFAGQSVVSLHWFYEHLTAVSSAFPRVGPFYLAAALSPAVVRHLGRHARDPRPNLSRRRHDSRRGRGAAGHGLQNGFAVGAEGIQAGAHGRLRASRRQIPAPGAGADADSRHLHALHGELRLPVHVARVPDEYSPTTAASSRGSPRRSPPRRATVS